MIVELVWRRRANGMILEYVMFYDDVTRYGYGCGEAMLGGGCHMGDGTGEGVEWGYGLNGNGSGDGGNNDQDGDGGETE